MLCSSCPNVYDGVIGVRAIDVDDSIVEFARCTDMEGMEEEALKFGLSPPLRFMVS